MRLHARDHFGGHKRLSDVVGAADLKGLVNPNVAARDKDDRNRFRARVTLQTTADGETVHVGKIDVEEHQIGPVFERHFNRFFPGLRRYDDVLIAKRAFHRAHHLRRIIDDEYFRFVVQVSSSRGHGGPVRAKRLSRRVQSKNVLFLKKRLRVTE